MNNNNNEDEYEKICYICRRPESKAGKMITMANNVCVCADCMQKTFDSINNSGFNYDDMMKMSNMNMNSFGNMFYGNPANNKTSNNSFDADEGNNSENNSGSDSGSSSGNMNDFMNNMGFGGMEFGNINMDIPNKQRLKKKKKGQTENKIDLRNIPAPHEIKHMLDDYVVGQENAKKIMSVAVYNHYKRVATNTMDEIEIEKSNMLMIGPTGSGKTYLVKTLAKLLQVPLAIADATSLTEAGYIGDDIESVVSKLLAAADNDVERAEHGIIFIDEIDKIAKKKETRSRDVSGESVQQGMLKLLEGSDIEVPVGATSKNAMVPQVTVNTRNILFICGGAFPDLEQIIKERLNKQSSIGFNADLKDKYDNEPNILENVSLEDLREFGMIPEFLGRLPIVFTLDGLSKDMLVKIMKEPRNAILKQYQKLLELDEVKLEFNDEALEAIADKALEKKTGARALRSIIEDYMLDIMYEIPKDKNIGSVTITGEYINKKGGPLIQMRESQVTLIGENNA